MSDTLAVVQIDNGFVLDSVDLVDNGSYALLRVASGATVTAERKWFCDARGLMERPHASCEKDKPNRCGWVTVVADA